MATCPALTTGATNSCPAVVVTRTSTTSTRTRTSTSSSTLTLTSTTTTTPWAVPRCNCDASLLAAGELACEAQQGACDPDPGTERHAALANCSRAGLLCQAREPDCGAAEAMWAASCGALEDKEQCEEQTLCTWRPPPLFRASCHAQAGASGAAQAVCRGLHTAAACRAQLVCTWRFEPVKEGAVCVTGQFRPCQSLRGVDEGACASLTKEAECRNNHVACRWDWAQPCQCRPERFGRWCEEPVAQWASAAPGCGEPSEATALPFCQGLALAAMQADPERDLSPEGTACQGNAGCLAWHALRENVVRLRRVSIFDLVVDALGLALNSLLALLVLLEDCSRRGRGLAVPRRARCCRGATARRAAWRLAAGLVLALFATDLVLDISISLNAAHTSSTMRRLMTSGCFPEGGLAYNMLALLEGKAQDTSLFGQLMMGSACVALGLELAAAYFDWGGEPEVAPAALPGAPASGAPPPRTGCCRWRRHISKACAFSALEAVFAAVEFAWVLWDYSRNTRTLLGSVGDLEEAMLTGQLVGGLASCVVRHPTLDPIPSTPLPWW